MEERARNWSTIGENLRKYIEAKGWSGAELARRANIKTTTLIDILNGRTDTPRTDLLTSILQHTDISPDFLFLGRGRPESFSPTGNTYDTVMEAGREIQRKIMETVKKYEDQQLRTDHLSKQIEHLRKTSAEIDRELATKRSKLDKDDVRRREMMLLEIEKKSSEHEYLLRNVNDLQMERAHWSKCLAIAKNISDTFKQSANDHKEKQDHLRNLQDTVSIVIKTIEIIERLAEKKELSLEQKLETAEIIAEEIYSSQLIGRSEEELSARIEKMMRFGRLLPDK